MSLSVFSTQFYSLTQDTIKQAINNTSDVIAYQTVLTVSICGGLQQMALYIYLYVVCVSFATWGSGPSSCNH